MLIVGKFVNFSSDWLFSPKRIWIKVITKKWKLWRNYWMLIGRARSAILYKSAFFQSQQDLQPIDFVIFFSISINLFFASVLSYPIAWYSNHLLKSVLNSLGPLCFTSIFLVENKHCFNTGSSLFVIVFMLLNAIGEHHWAILHDFIYKFNW